MIWLYMLIAVAIVIIVFFLLAKKGKNPNNDASMSIEEKEELQEDYLSHGSHTGHDDNKNV